MTSIWTEIRGKFVRPNLHESLCLPKLSLSEDESEDVLDAFSEIDTISGIALILEYADARGRCSQRLVTCKRLEENDGVAYIRAFCHLREQVRSFRVDRIQSLFDPSTGECLDPVLAYFEGYSRDAVTKSPYGWGMSVQRRADFVSLLNALVFIARCDREFHPLEISSIEDFVTKFWLRMEISGEPDVEAVASYIERLAPDAETFWVAMHRLAVDPKLVKLLKESARNTISADGRQTPEEFFWGSKIDEFFPTV